MVPGNFVGSLGLSFRHIPISIFSIYGASLLLIIGGMGHITCLTSK